MDIDADGDATTSDGVNTLAKLVKRTREHANFQRHFNLPSFGVGWARLRR